MAELGLRPVSPEARLYVLSMPPSLESKEERLQTGLGDTAHPMRRSSDICRRHGSFDLIAVTPHLAPRVLSLYVCVSVCLCVCRWGCVVQGQKRKM